MRTFSPGGRRSAWAQLTVLLAGQFIANVDSAVANVAAPSIHASLDASQGEVALVVSGYLVAFAALLISGARLGAVLGHRRTFLTGLLVFTLASLACGLAPGILWLILSRFVQGAGAAMMVPQVLSGIQLRFAGEQRVRALGYYTLALSGGAVAGQVLGGFLVSADLYGSGWRTIFLINVPIGALLLVAASAILPRDLARGASRTDPGGVVALALSILLVIVPLLLGGDQGWPPWTWLCLAASVPAAASFVLIERRVTARGGRPLINPASLRGRATRYGLCAHGLITMTYFALLFAISFYLQQGLGVGAAFSGLAMVSWVAAFGVAGLVLPRLPARHLSRAPLIGCLLLAASYASICGYVLVGGRDGPLLFVFLGAGGLGLGIGSGSLINAITRAVPADGVSDTSGVITTNSQLGGAFGVAVASAVYAGARSGFGMDAAAAFPAVLAVLTLIAVVGCVAAWRSARPPVRGGSAPAAPALSPTPDPSQPRVRGHSE